MSDPESDAISFRSPDGRYGLHLLSSPAQQILSLGQEAAPSETGGILVGRYVDSNHVAEVSKAIGPPPDSAGGRFWFERGKSGLANRLDVLWDDGLYYLGEWHTHPDMLPRPSITDRFHMRRIQRSASYNCAVPALVIAGRSIARKDMSAFVFPRGQPKISLERSTPAE